MPDVGAPWDFQDAEPHSIDGKLDTLMRQLSVLGLEELVLRRWVNGVPDVKQVTFGGGALAEQTLQFVGDVKERFAGACVLNYSAAPVSVGFAPGAGNFTQYVANPGMGIVVPQNFTDLSLAVPAAFAAGPALTPVSVARLWVAPFCPLVFPLNPAWGLSDTVGGAGVVLSPGAGATIATIPATKLPAGTYEVDVVLSLGGAAGTSLADGANTQLLAGANVVTILATTEAGGIPAGSPSTVFKFKRLTLNGSQALTVQAIAAGTVNAAYTATILATRIL